MDDIRVLPTPLPPPLITDYLHHQIYMRHLLLCCAQLISRSDFSAAHHLISFLSAHSSPSGDSSDRVIHHFTTALSLRLHRHLSHQLPPPQHNILTLQSSYLSLNQITPFIRFSHLTSNQAILETIEQYSHRSQHIHILDFNIMHGVQWPPLMQSIAYRHPPVTLIITAIGTTLSTLQKTGNHLAHFAHSLGLSFEFHPLVIPDHDIIDDIIHQLSRLTVRPNELLVVNCVFYLHRLLRNPRDAILLIRWIKSMNPKLMTLSEQEASHNHPLFLSRFSNALKYYTAVFESLEATLPGKSGQRMEVEEMWFGREIADVVAAEGEKRKERHEKFVSREVMMNSVGLRNIPVSRFAVAQAKMLLRLYYPSEGYNLEVYRDCYFLGWRNQPLFLVSSWR